MYTRKTVLVVMAILFITSVTAKAQVYFADENLKAAVASALPLQPPDPTGADMWRLDRLAAPGRGISDLTGLEYAPNLRFLYLYDNEISDISVVSGLTKLIRLELDNNQIIDISAVSGLTRMVELELSHNQISDISAVSGLTNLTYLGLHNNQIIDISAVSGLTNLTKLDLEYNRISNISAVSGLTNLRTLWLDNNQIIDISAVSGLTDLTWLLLEENWLNCPAYDIYIPMIETNNPGINLDYDPRPEDCLSQNKDLELVSIEVLGQPKQGEPVEVELVIANNGIVAESEVTYGINPKLSGLTFPVSESLMFNPLPMGLIQSYQD